MKLENIGMFENLNEKLKYVIEQIDLLESIKDQEASGRSTFIKNFNQVKLSHEVCKVTMILTSEELEKRKVDLEEAIEGLE